MQQTCSNLVWRLKFQSIYLKRKCCHRFILKMGSGRGSLEEKANSEFIENTVRSYV